MSEAILCDRCGKKMLPHMGSRLENKWSLVDATYDLCHDCAKDFKAFMKNKGGEEDGTAPD